ncbi:MAG: DUF86 domain-containing protein [Methanotrichaceae archaeon]
MRDALRRILDYTGEGKDAFFEDSKTQDAVVRNLEIVGEAVKNLSPQFKANYPEIHWKAISGMRDKLIHEYFGVNLDLVWHTIEHDVPGFLQEIEKVLMRR